jgi:hypothetical protein
MNELENLVLRNGKWYDRRTNNRVFVKQPTINDNSVEGTNVPLEGDNATESLTEPLQGVLEAIVKPPVKRSGRPRKQTT